MRSWVGLLCLVLFAGGAGIVGSGCGRTGAVPKDAGAPLDIARPSGGVDSGGVVGTGGLTTEGGSGGSSQAGSRGTALGGSALGGAGAAGTTSSGGAGGVGGAEARRSDAGELDAPGSDVATGTGGASGSGGATRAGGATGPGGRIGGRTSTDSATGLGGVAGAGGVTGIGGAIGTGGGTGAGGSTSSGGGPCDIYAAASPATPCVAAYSTVRALLGAYSGKLYQVKKKADGTTKDIGVLVPGGFANSADQDMFCGTDACTISIIYDQSGKGNHLTKAPPGCYMSTGDYPANESDAKGRSLTVGGHKVYALYMIAVDGYRNNKTTGMPIGDQAQGIYEVVDGKRFDVPCCWDFGNASTDNCNGPPGQSNTLFFGIGYWGKGADSGPWFLADFQPGVWSGGSGASTATNPQNPSITYDYAIGILKTNATNYAIRVGNAQSGNLATAYDGPLPFTPWKMKGGIVLGIASDRSDGSYGTFFEGAITAGRPSDATDAAVLQNVQAARYGE